MGPALRLIPSLMLWLILNLVLPSQLVLCIYVRDPPLASRTYLYSLTPTCEAPTSDQSYIPLPSHTYL